MLPLDRLIPYVVPSLLRRCVCSPVFQKVARDRVHCYILHHCHVSTWDIIDCPHHILTITQFTVLLRVASIRLGSEAFHEVHRIRGGRHPQPPRVR